MKQENVKLIYLQILQMIQVPMDEWYKEKVLMGARENNLALEYFDYWERLPAKLDNQKNRFPSIKLTEFCSAAKRSGKSRLA